MRVRGVRQVSAVKLTGYGNYTSAKRRGGSRWSIKRWWRWLMLLLSRCDRPCTSRSASRCLHDPPAGSIIK
jgi:hypothetical protein